jgi:hypothetical protein
MDKSQAEQVVRFLKSQLYIMEYCDCCENSPFQLIKIEKVTMEPADNNLFEVRVIGKEVAVFGSDKMGNLLNPRLSTKSFNDVISVNYTFIAENEKAVCIAQGLQFSEVAGYEVDASCQQFVNLPQPTLAVFSANTDYKNWYKAQAKKVNYNSLLVGNWINTSVKTDDGTQSISGSEALTLRFNADKTWSSGTWSIEGNELNLTAGSHVDKMIFNVSDDLLQIKTQGADKSLIIMSFSKQ